MSANEDLMEGDVPSHALPDDHVDTSDSDQVNKSVLIEVIEEMEQDIAALKTTDALLLPKNASDEDKINAYNDMALHHLAAAYLDKYKLKLKTKVEELK